MDESLQGVDGWKDWLIINLKTRRPFLCVPAFSHSKDHQIPTCRVAFEYYGHVCFDVFPWTANVAFFFFFPSLCFCLHIIYREINVKFGSSVLMRLQHLERAKCSHYFGVGVRVNYSCFITFVSCTSLLNASWVKVFQFSSVCVLVHAGSFAFPQQAFVSQGLLFLQVCVWAECPTGNPRSIVPVCLYAGIVVEVKNAADCSVTLKGWLKTGPLNSVKLAQMISVWGVFQLQ